MSSTPTAARRRRRFLLATSMLAPSSPYSLRPRAAAAIRPTCRRSKSARRPTRTRPAPGPPTMKARRAAPVAAPTAPRAGTEHGHVERRHGASPAPAPAAAAGGRQFTGIVGTSSTVITAEDIAHSPSHNLPEIIAQAPGVQLHVAVWRRQRRQDHGRPARLRRLRHRQHAGPDQRPAAQRHRHGAGRSLDHSAQFDRAHRDHPRQQRRGALRRQRGRRRHQHRHQDRRRRPAGRDPRRGRRRLLQPAHGLGLDRDQFRPVVDVVLRQRHQVRRLPRQQRARPAQRRRQPQLHHARPQGLPDGDRRRPEARLPRRPARRSLDRRSTSSSPTAGAPARRSTTATSRAPAPPRASPRPC